MRIAHASEVAQAKELDAMASSTKHKPEKVIVVCPASHALVNE